VCAISSGCNWPANLDKEGECLQGIIEAGLDVTKVLRVTRHDGYGPTSCCLIAFLAEFFQLFARKRSYSQPTFRLFKGEHYMKTTTQTQALVDTTLNRIGPLIQWTLLIRG
jgi:hypothetical protein